MARITESLFGVTPESLMMQRDQEAQAQALAMARMSPAEMGRFGIAYGANKLAGAVGGLLGAKDPELERLTARQNMLKGLDLGDPESLKAAASQALQSGDYSAAQELAARARDIEAAALEAEVKQSQIAKNLRERTAADPVQQLIRAGKYTPASVEKYQETGKISDLEAIEKNDPTAITEANGRVLLVNKQNGAVIQDLGVAPKRGTSVTTNVMPEKPNDILGVRSQLNTTLKPFRDAVNAADTGINLVDEALKNKNFAAASAVPRQLAKAVGETQISNQDVKNFGGDPSLIGSVADTLTRLAKGTPTEDTLKKMRQVLYIVRKKNQALENQEIEQTKRLARESGRYSEAEIDTLFNLRPSNKREITTRAGNKVTIED